MDSSIHSLLRILINFSIYYHSIINQDLYIQYTIKGLNCRISNHQVNNTCEHYPNCIHLIHIFHRYNLPYYKFHSYFSNFYIKDAKNIHHHPGIPGMKFQYRPRLYIHLSILNCVDPSTYEDPNIHCTMKTINYRLYNLEASIINIFHSMYVLN